MRIRGFGIRQVIGKKRPIDHKPEEIGFRNKRDYPVNDIGPDRARLLSKRSLCCSVAYVRVDVQMSRRGT
jgi:hypothetical protein